MSQIQEIFLICFVRKSYFTLEKHNKTYFRMITLQKIILCENAKARKLYLIIVNNIYCFQIFSPEFSAVWQFRMQ